MNPTELSPDASNVQAYCTVHDMPYEDIVKHLGHPKNNQWVYRTSWGVAALRPSGNDIVSATSWQVLGEPDPLTGGPKAADFLANYLDGTRP